MSIGTFLSLALLALVAAAGASIFFYTLENGISPSPTPPRVRRRLLEIIRDLGVSGPIYELGSGWGTLAFPLARLHPDAPVIGYETSPVPYTVSILLRLLFPRPNLQLHRLDFLQQDLSGAALVVTYQSPGNMATLRPKLEAELSDDAIVVSNTFAVPGWKPADQFQIDDLFKTRIYVYRVGAAKPLRRDKNKKGQP